MTPNQATTTDYYHLPKATGIHDLTKSTGQIPSLGPNEALLKIRAVSLNYRDLLVAKGQYLRGVKPDVIPCSDASGEIVGLGSAVAHEKWKIGDKVCANFSTDHLFGDVNEEIVNTSLGGQADGVLTQYKVIPAHCLVAIPDGWTHEEASTLPCAAVTAYNALIGPVPVKAGDVVLIQGTGGVSIFALQLARASGAVVIATSSSDEKLKVAKDLGASHLINYRKTPNWGEEALKLTGGRGVDHVIEVGGAGTLEESFKAVRYGGWIHTIGILSKGEPKDVALKCLSKSAYLRGILIGSVKQFEDLVRLINANGLRPVVDKVFGFDQAKDAYEHLESQKHIGKVVITVA